MARAAVRVSALRGCTAAAYLREHVLAGLDDELGQVLGRDVRNSPALGSRSVEDDLVVALLTGRGDELVRLEILAVLRVHVQHIGNASLLAAFEHFFEAYRNDRDAQLAGLLGELFVHSARQRGVYAHEWCGSAAPRQRGMRGRHLGCERRVVWGQGSGVTSQISSEHE